eukprot:Pgem_evm3s827
MMYSNIAVLVAVATACTVSAIPTNKINEKCLENYQGNEFMIGECIAAHNGSPLELEPCMGRSILACNQNIADGPQARCTFDFNTDTCKADTPIEAQIDGLCNARCTTIFQGNEERISYCMTECKGTNSVIDKINEKCLKDYQGNEFMIGECIAAHKGSPLQLEPCMGRSIVGCNQQIADGPQAKCTFDLNTNTCKADTPIDAQIDDICNARCTTIFQGNEGRISYCMTECKGGKTNSRAECSKMDGKPNECLPFVSKGKCLLVEKQCVQPNYPHVSCGGHTASSCEWCPYDHVTNILTTGLQASSL